MKSKTAKIKRSQNMDKFLELLPKLEKKFYSVVSHGPSNAPNTMYKITMAPGGKVYDYYPMSGRVSRIVNGKYVWHSLSVDDLLERFKTGLYK